VAKLTQGRGVELITDPLGGLEWKRSYRALRHTGRLGMFGASTATESRLPGPLKLLKVGLGMPWFNPVALMNQNRSVFGVNLGHLWHEVPKIEAWMKALVEGVNAGWVRPHVDRTFLLAQAGEAHAYIEARKNTGKVVLVI
jgi:NADPH:quinone reductase-like Zn-dependent oxidoreductase